MKMTQSLWRKSLAVLLLALSGFVSAVLAVGEQPKLMVIMQEKVMGVLGTTGYEQPNQSELSLMQHFARLGYRVVDPATVKRNITQSKGLRLLEGDDKAAAAVGLQHGAHYSIIGTAISKPAGAKLYGTQMQSIHATLSARLVRNADSRVLASASASGVQAHLDEVQGGVMAIEQAARLLAEDLAARIPAADLPGAAAGGEVQLTITGLVSYRHLAFVMNYLETKLPGVSDLAINGYSAGVGELGVMYSGRSAELAKKLATERFKGFRLEPTHVTAGRIDLRAVLRR